MIRGAVMAAAVAALAVGGVVVASTRPAPVSELEYVIAESGDNYFRIAADNELSCNGTQLWQANGRAPLDPGTIVFIPPSCQQEVSVTTTTAPPETTTTQPPATTVAPTTTAPPTSTTLPSETGPQFVETFDTLESMDRLGSWVYHRNVDEAGFGGFSGGTWLGDHDVDCNSPVTTSRTLSWDRTTNQSVRRANSVYWCPSGTGHFMTSMGDVDGYSVVAVWPEQVFDTVESVCVDISLTDLGTRQWPKIGVVTDALFRSRPKPNVPGFLASDVAASNLSGSLAGPDRMIASWSGGASAGYRGFLKIGNTNTSTRSDPSPESKTIRHPVCLVDNGDGTVTFTVAGVSVTRPGSFPAGPKRVVLYQHSYTPSKSESGSWGTTIHWDNLIID